MQAQGVGCLAVLNFNDVYGFLQFYWMPFNFSLAVAVMGGREFKLGHSHKETKCL